MMSLLVLYFSRHVEIFFKSREEGCYFNILNRKDVALLGFNKKFPFMVTK